MTVKILGQISWENKICVFFIFSNGGITEMTKIETEWQNAEQERQEDFIQHEPPEVEFVFYNQVQQGDVASVEKNLKSGQYRHIAMKTRLSTDLVQNFRYHCIISLAMVTRFCIEGGMPGEQAYRMSDFYIHKVDEATTIDLVEELHDAACMDYAKRMQQIKNKAGLFQTGYTLPELHLCAYAREDHHRRPGGGSASASQLFVPALPGTDGLYAA